MKDQNQRVCLRCKVVFMGNPDDALCLTCKGGLQRSEERQERVRKQTEPPENPIIETLIVRDGDTVCQIGSTRYTFKRNLRNHAVCVVTNPMHHKFLLRQPELYRLYQPEGDQVAP